MANDTVEFWKSSFGDEYTERNRPTWQDRIPLLQKMVDLTGASSFLDVGTNSGWNLMALRSINPAFEMSGVDINLSALKEAQSAGFDVAESAAWDVATLFGRGAADLVITSGVLIHIAPDDLQRTMQAIIDVSKSYILAIEYDSPEVREIDYRGHKDRLWARPYGDLYTKLGCDVIETGVAEGYSQCHYWLVAK